MNKKIKKTQINNQGSVVVFILARSGSKGIPNKNIMNFMGKPLIAWSILQAKNAVTIDDVVVSSDSNHYLQLSESYGALPILRPIELSTDTSSSESALLHALDSYESLNGRVETVVFLQATSPLRESSDIDGAVNKFRDQQADSLFTDAVLDDFCSWVDDGNGLKGKTFDPYNRGRRQDRNPIYLENGSIYVFRPQLLRTTGNRIGGKIARYSMDFWKSFEIDTKENIELCEYYFERKLLPSWKNKDVESVKCLFTPKLIVYDFDGVMTDNKVIISEDGSESVVANRADGLGVRELKNFGFRQIILSTEENKVVSARGRKLQIEVIQGSHNKVEDLKNFCANISIDMSSVLYVGNDVNDLEVMQNVGFSVAPSDAHPTILSIADYVTKTCGGQGVIKELSEWLNFGV